MENSIPQTNVDAIVRFVVLLHVQELKGEHPRLGQQARGTQFARERSEFVMVASIVEQFLPQQQRRQFVQCKGKNSSWMGKKKKSEREKRGQREKKGRTNKKAICTNSPQKFDFDSLVLDWFS
jgi:hypothetical protein